MPEPLDPGGIERAGRCGGMETGAPEDFVGHPVADPREVLLHEENRFEWGPAAAFEETREAFQRKFLGKNARREGGPPRGRRGSLVEADAAEVAFVLEDEGARVLPEDEVVVFAWIVVRLVLAAEFAAHAEVDAEPEVVGKLEKHLLAAGLGGEKFFPGEQGLNSSGISIAEDPDFRADKSHAENGLAKSRVPLATAVFDFGEFRHGWLEDDGAKK